MTRKDYVMIAETIRELLGDIDRDKENEDLTDWSRAVLAGERIGVYTLAHHLSYQLHSENTRFDRTRFIEACGLTA